MNSVLSFKLATSFPNFSMISNFPNLYGKIGKYKQCSKLLDPEM